MENGRIPIYSESVIALMTYVKLTSAEPTLREAKQEYKNWRMNLKRDYNLTPLDWNRLMVGQNYLCALCGQPFGQSKAVPDHDHKTEQVRGLVHLKCNIIIGNIENWHELVSSYLSRCRPTLEP